MRKLNKKFKRFNEDLLDNGRAGIKIKGHDINHNVKMILRCKVLSTLIISLFNNNS